MIERCKIDVDPWYSRSFFYELEHVVFGGEPNEQLFAVLSSPDCLLSLESLDGPDLPLSSLLQYANRLSDANFALTAMKETRSVYNHVILGLGKRISHLRESTYTSPHRLMMQEETLDVRKAYRAFGYLPKQCPRVADDHISLEYSFLAMLAQESIEAVRRDDFEKVAALAVGQKNFIEDHVLKWIDSYAINPRADAPGSLYDMCATSLSSYAKKTRRFSATPSRLARCLPRTVTRPPRETLGRSSRLHDRKPPLPHLQ